MPGGVVKWTDYSISKRRGDPKSLYIRKRDDECSFSSRAKTTKKASPPPPGREEVLKFLGDRISHKSKKTLGHYDAARVLQYGVPGVALHDQQAHEQPSDRRRKFITWAGQSMMCR